MTRIAVLFSFILFLQLGLSAQVPCKSEELSPAAFSQKMKTTKDVQLVDIREPEELKYGYLDGARNINYYEADFEKKILAQLKKDKPVMIYCMSGYRSAKAAAMLCKFGFMVVYDLRGGAYAWEKAGFPMK